MGNVVDDIIYLCSFLFLLNVDVANIKFHSIIFTWENINLLVFKREHLKRLNIFNVDVAIIFNSLLITNLLVTSTLTHCLEHILLITSKIFQMLLNSKYNFLSPNFDLSILF